MPMYRYEFVGEPGVSPVFVDLPDVEAAKAEALKSLAETVIDKAIERSDASGLQTKIYDDAGYLLATVTMHDFAGVIHVAVLKPFRQVAGDVARPVVGKQTRPLSVVALSQPDAVIARFSVSVVRRLHGRAQLPGDDVAGEVVEDGRQIKPAPADDLQIGKVGLPELVGRCFRTLRPCISTVAWPRCHRRSNAATVFVPRLAKPRRK